MNDMQPRDQKKVSLLRVLSNRWLIISAAVVAAYALLGFFLFPYLVKHYVEKYGTENLGSRLTLRQVTFNPFTMTLRSENFSLQEKDGTPILTFDSFLASLGISSLYYRAWTFSKITMEHPFMNLVVEKDGSSNLSRLFKGFGSKNKNNSGKKKGIPRLLLKNVNLQGGKFDFSDQRKAPAAEVQVQFIDVRLKELTSLPDRTGEYTISGTTNEGENVRWKGNISLSPLHSVGSMVIGGLKASTVWKFLGNRQATSVPAGKVGLECDYLFDLGGRGAKLSLTKVKFSVSDPSLTQNDRVKMSASRIGGAFSATIDWDGKSVQGAVTETNATVEALSLGLSGEEKPLLKLAKGELLGGHIDLRKRTADFTRVLLTEGSTEVTLHEGGKSNWSLLGGLVQTPKEEKKQGGVEKTSPTWATSLGSLEVRNFRVALNDLSTGAPASMTLEPVGLILSNVSTNPASPFKFEFHAKVKEGGELSVDGSATVGAEKGEGNITVKDFSLLPLQSYLSRIARLNMKSGKLDASGRFTYDPQGEGGRFVYQGKMSLPSLLLVEQETGDPFLSWDLLSTSGMTFTLSPNALRIEEVDLVKPGAKLIILENRRINVSEIMVKKTREEPKEHTPGPGMEVTVDRVGVKEASLQFADLSLKPQFGTLIHSLSGVVNGISSVPKTRAGIELDGEVDKYGTARIRGRMNVFEPAGSTNVRMDFRNVDMTHLTPYAVRFAGYRIASGKLSLDLRYRIENSQMLGENHIIAEQFVLGERVESPTALDLPIALAVALLRDSKGVIDIGLPVRGDLKNPQFDFGQLISKALGALLTKIVTAPFAWLASLVGAEKEDLDVILFDPGEVTLLAPQQEKLTKLSEGLKKRPELKVEVQGGYDKKLDARALRSMLMRTRLAAKEYPAFKPGEKPGPVVFHNPDTQAAIEALFLEQHSRDELSKLHEEYQKSLAAQKKSLVVKNQPAEWADFYRSLYRRMEETLEISDTKLEEVARARAAQVKQYLVNEKGIDTARVDLLQPAATGSKDNKQVITKLSLGAAR
jgi:uncharacterized protein involved in outer membrane biogenesis